MEEVKLLKGPHGWNSYGKVALVVLERHGGPGPIRNRKQVEDALMGHCCYPPAVRKILSCLEHSRYECLMRRETAHEVITSEALKDAGINFWVKCVYTPRAHERSQ